MAAATVRVVVLMTREEKAELEAKAERSGRISAAELVRRAVDAYDLGDQREAEELRASWTCSGEPTRRHSRNWIAPTANSTMFCRRGRMRRNEPLWRCGRGYRPVTTDLI